MLAEYRNNSQIALPYNIVSKLGLSVGDIFDVTEKDGGIFLCKKERESKSRQDYLAKLNELYGSINDPTFVAPSEIAWELNAPCEEII